MGKNVRTVNIDSELQAIVGEHTRLTVGASVVMLAELPDNCSHVLLSVDTQPVRMSMDSVDPTAAIGHLMGPGTTWTMKKSQAALLKFIRSGGSSGYVQATPAAY
jgi:hypothetical protein